MYRTYEPVVHILDRQTGTDRVYQTPPLPAGKMQIYTVRAKWNQDGRDVEQFRVVGVRAGETSKLNFMAK